MKDVKIFAIGFLLSACMFLLMGNSTHDSQAAKYQAFSHGDTFYLLNTSTADVFQRQVTSKGNNVWQLVLYADH